MHSILCSVLGHVEDGKYPAPMWHKRGVLLPCLVLAVLPFASGYAALKQPTYEEPVTDEELTSPITK